MSRRVATPSYPDGMALDLPRTLSPSKVVAFTNCPLAFRYSQIERLPEPPSPHAVKGTLVHAALEGLFWHHSPGARTPAAAQAELGRCWDELQHDEEYAELALDSAAAADFVADAGTLVDNYFRLEDPNQVRAVGIELGVETVVDGMRLRGIIDRLDLAADGSLVVVDYKTGRAPSERFERGSMSGVQTYALLCENVLGRAPSEVRLLYLRQPVAISATPSEQTIRGQRKRAAAVWTAIARACDAEDFRPNVGPLCEFCHFKASCPAFAA
jgi:putative RecB family exonuclease